MLNEKANISNNPNNKNISNKEKPYNTNQKESETLTTFESKKYNDFLGVFGVHAANSKYYKPKKVSTKILSKTPSKKEKDDNNIINKERHCKTPFKLHNLLFFPKTKEKNQINNINVKNKEESKKEKENKDSNKPQKKIKNPSKIYELSFYEPFNELVNLLDGEGNSYQVAFVRNEFEIKMIFNNIYKSLNNIIFTNDFFSFPQYCIHAVEYNPDTKITLIKLKDYRSFKIQTEDDEFYKKISFNPKSRIDFFKYAFLYNVQKKEDNTIYPIEGWKLYDPMKEFKERQKVPLDMDSFRISQINNKYKLCETYPSFIIVPSNIDDSTIEKMASCRSKKRFPLLTYVYTHPNNNSGENNELIQTFLFRSSQINTGLLFKKNNSEEIEYINALTSVGKYNEGFIFYDCRPYISAKANALKGAGTDETSQYFNCKELIFGNIENIHAVRDSLKKAIEKVYYGMSQINNGKLSFNSNNTNFKKFLSKFEESKWLDYLSDILTGTNVIINKLKSRLNVICHCSDGWDRTSQVCSLVQIILDPYFRTFEGFAVLIEKDWISFGHQFAIRNGCDFRIEKKKERSPIFIQFLHCVYQIMIQHPTAFEFEQNLLIYLSEEIYSNKFGTFLFNCEKELEENNAREITLSIWSDIFLNKKKYVNPYYKEIKEQLEIKTGVQYLNIWKEFFYKYIKIGLVKEGEDEINQIKNMENIKIKQNENIIELLNIIKKNGLEKQMENNELYKVYKDYLNP